MQKSPGFESIELRSAAVGAARRLNRLTISWNVAEGATVIVAGAHAGSASLVGFGLDSAIEVSAAVFLAWRLAQESGGGCMAVADRRATRLIASLFAALAGYVGLESARDLIGRRPPRPASSGSCWRRRRWS